MDISILRTGVSFGKHLSTSASKTWKSSIASLSTSKCSTRLRSNSSSCESGSISMSLSGYEKMSPSGYEKMSTDKSSSSSRTYTV
jgi:hypothetical protein